MVTIIDPALKDGVIDYFVINIHELIRFEIILSFIHFTHQP